MRVQFGRRRVWAALAVAAGLISAASLFAQSGGNFGVHTAGPRINREDKPDTWTMGLRFKDVRTAVAEVPGRGRKTVYYMWYQVFNTSAEPRIFIPDFELVTHDRGTVHRDEVLPAVQEAVRRIESSYLKFDQFKNPVTIAESPVPVTPEGSDPRTVTGVALWTDVDDRARGTTNFSVLVSGLSNGWVKADQDVIRRKTLQINFRRRTDASRPDLQEIRFARPEVWTYVGSAYNILGKPDPGKPAAAPKE